VERTDKLEEGGILEKKWISLFGLLVLGFVIGQKFSREAAILSKIEVQPIAKSQAEEAMTDQTITPKAKQATTCETINKLVPTKTDVAAVLGAITDEQLTEKIKSLPMYKVRELYYAKEDDFYKKKVTSKFKYINDDEDGNYSELYRLLYQMASISYFWFGENTITLNNKDVRVQYALNFSNFADPKVPLEKWERICFYMNAYFDFDSKLYTAGAGGCGYEQMDNQYYFQLPSYSMPLSQYFTVMEIAIPSGRVSDTQFILNEDSDWQNGPSIYWEPKTEEEFNALRDELMQRVN